MYSCQDIAGLSEVRQRANRGHCNTQGSTYAAPDYAFRTRQGVRCGLRRPSPPPAAQRPICHSSCHRNIALVKVYVTLLSSGLRFMMMTCTQKQWGNNRHCEVHYTFRCQTDQGLRLQVARLRLSGFPRGRCDERHKRIMSQICCQGH